MANDQSQHQPQSPEEPTKNPTKNSEVTFLTIMQSVFLSFIGVQNNKNRKRDFESGKFWHFFAAGLIFVLIFMLSIWLGVKYLIATSV